MIDFFCFLVNITFGIILEWDKIKEGFTSKHMNDSQTLKCNECQLEISAENEAKGKRGRGRPRKKKVEYEIFFFFVKGFSQKVSGKRNNEFFPKQLLD
ncbi:hypothetical protein BpHYR1_012955 [Brachionus plicatilis]|uniref:Uncharacterized protein n=1 Tax=Brachionus plicatilis TaxID=10195 RepID=A0A3M7RBL6_BRAPC|nr:hypothetical protein BpHYR1_012955 [Brachionus plicatilis]